jgi:hypothetical protein
MVYLLLLHLVAASITKGILNNVYKTLAEVEVEYKLKLKD